MSNPEKRKSCGCVATGCIVLIVIAALLAGLSIWSFKKMSAHAREYTSTGPSPVPGENVAEGEYDALIKRINAFTNAPSGSAQTLELSAHDFNVLVAACPQWEAVRGSIHVTIDGDVVGVTGSIPLTFITQLQDRYLNGEIHFIPSKEDKPLRIDLRDITLQSMKAMRKINLTKDEANLISTYCALILSNPAVPVLGPVLMRAKTLTTKDGVITVTSD